MCCVLENSCSVLIELNGEVLAAGLCGAQWVTTNKGMASEHALYAERMGPFKNALIALRHPVVKH